MDEPLKREEQVDELHGQRGALTENNEVRGLGLRACTSWTPAESSVQRKLRSPLSGDTGVVGDPVGRYQGRPPLDQVRALDHGDRQSTEDATFSRLQGIGETQGLLVDSRQPPPSQQLRTPPHQRRPSWQSTSLVTLARLSAGNAAATATPTATPTAAARSHIRTNSDGFSMVSSSSSPALEGEAAAPEYAGSGGRSVLDGSGHAPDRYHRRNASYQSQWSPPNTSGHALGAKGWRGQDRGGAGTAHLRPPPGEHSYHQYPSPSSPMSVENLRGLVYESGAAGGISDNKIRGHQPGISSWPAAPAVPSSSTTTSGSGSEQQQQQQQQQYRETGWLQPTPPAQRQGGRYGGTITSPSVVTEGEPAGIDAHGIMRNTSWPSSHVRSFSSGAAKAALTMTAPGGWSDGVEPRSGRVGGGLAPLLGPGGGRWTGRAGRSSSGPRAYMDIEHERELYSDDLPHHDNNVESQGRGQQHHRQSSQPPLASMLCPAGVGAGINASPTLGRHVSDPGRHGATAAARSMASARAAADSPRSSPYPWAGLAGAASAAVGVQAPGGRDGFTPFGELHDTSGGGRFRDGGGGGWAVGAAGAAGTARAGAGGAPTAEGGSANRPRKIELALTGSPTCLEEGCDKRPRFSNKNQTKPTYCAKHRRVGMVDPRHPRCKAEQCGKQPSFGLEGDRGASFCARHKKAGMVNVTSRRCQQTGCIRNPNFGFPGDKRATRCKGHRDMGMVDIVSRHCQDPSCTTRPLYNMKGLRPMFCRAHKLPEMIDVISSRCQEPKCSRHPSFGYASDMKALRCARHRLENMVGVKGRRQMFRRKGITAAAGTAAPMACPTQRSSASSSSTSSSSGSAQGTGDRGRSITKPTACVDETRGLPASWIAVL